MGARTRLSRAFLPALRQGDCIWYAIGFEARINRNRKCCESVRILGQFRICHSPAPCGGRGGAPDPIRGGGGGDDMIGRSSPQQRGSSLPFFSYPEATSPVENFPGPRLFILSLSKDAGGRAGGGDASPTAPFNAQPIEMIGAEKRRRPPNGAVRFIRGQTFFSSLP
jgi:hypothetical protein